MGENALSVVQEGIWNMTMIYPFLKEGVIQIIISGFCVDTAIEENQVE